MDRFGEERSARDLSDPYRLYLAGCTSAAGFGSEFVPEDLSFTDSLDAFVAFISINLQIIILTR